jgi:hypothetical protein
MATLLIALKRLKTGSTLKWPDTCVTKCISKRKRERETGNTNRVTTVGDESPEHLKVSELEPQEAYMKQHLRNIVLTAGLSVLLGTCTLEAQDQRAVANIPFAYQVGQKTLTAGRYAIQKVNAAPGVFRLRDEQLSHSIFLSATPLDTGRNNESKLTFSCYAGQCSLSEVWMAGNGYRSTARPPVSLGRVAAMISVPLR